MYASAQNKYLCFCHSIDYAPLPLSEHLLCLFIASLQKEGLRYSTMKTYLSGLRHFSISSGKGDPHIAAWPRLEYVLKGVKRAQAEVRSRPRLPITPLILSKLRSVWVGQPLMKDGPMLWAASPLGFFGFLRAGEFTVPSNSAFDSSCHLSLADISIDSYQNPSVMCVTIKKSKTDPFRHGVQLFIGRNHSVLCPVGAMLSYLVHRGNSEGPLFKFESGAPLSRHSLVVHLRLALTKANFDASDYCGHSFRIGAATTAAAHGVEDSLIKTLGRWESSAYQRYIKISREKLANVSSILCQAVPSRRQSPPPQPQQDIN